jgi:molecular chaperone DnaK
LEEALKKEDKAEIEAKMQALSEASAALAQKMYAEQAQDASAGNGSSDDGAGGDTVDAEFEEVKDDDKK